MDGFCTIVDDDKVWSLSSGHDVWWEGPPVIVHPGRSAKTVQLSLLDVDRDLKMYMRILLCLQVNYGKFQDFEAVVGYRTFLKTQHDYMCHRLNGMSIFLNLI
jgi:hypothetical protein